MGPHITSEPHLTFKIPQTRNSASCNSRNFEVIKSHVTTLTTTSRLFLFLSHSFFPFHTSTTTTLPPGCLPSRFVIRLSKYVNPLLFFFYSICEVGPNLVLTKMETSVAPSIMAHPWPPRGNKPDAMSRAQRRAAPHGADRKLVPAAFFSRRRRLMQPNSPAQADEGDNILVVEAPADLEPFQTD